MKESMPEAPDKWRTAKCYQCKHFNPLLPYCSNNPFSRDLPDGWSGEHTACTAFEEAESEESQ